MKESDNFTKLILLNRWKEIILILDPNTKIIFITDIDEKE